MTEDAVAPWSGDCPLTTKASRTVEGWLRSVGFEEGETHEGLLAIEAEARHSDAAEVERLPMFDDRDRITDGYGERMPRTPADYVECYRARVLAALSSTEAVSNE